MKCKRCGEDVTILMCDNCGRTHDALPTLERIKALEDALRPFALRARGILPHDVHGGPDEEDWRRAAEVMREKT